MRQIESVAGERNKRRIALAGFEALQVSILENEERPPLILLNRTAVRENIDTFSGIALIIDKNTHKQPARLAALDTDRQRTEFLKFTWPQDVRQNIRANFRLPPSQRPEAFRCKIK